MKQQSKKENRRNHWIWIYMIVLFIIFLTVWLIQAVERKRQAAEDVQLVYQVLGELDTGVLYEEIAANLLKGNGNKDAAERGLLLLSEYGYGADYVTAFDERANREITKLAVFYLFVYLFLDLMLFGIRRAVSRERTDDYCRIQEVIEDFYNENYELSDRSCGEDVENLLYARMESLGQKIMLKEERLWQEKEDTKVLITDLSHQLKTPVASIKMCFQMIEEEELTQEEKEEFLKRLGDQISHLEGLLAALVNISRMETGMIEIRKEWSSIFETVASAVNQVYMKAEEKEIEIIVEDVPKEIERLQLPHDVKWTKEAIVNVLENAIKYSPAGSDIHIRIVKQTQFLRIEIQDEGIGIKKEDVNRIFQRFYRGGHAVVKQAEGSGVGLYLTRKILEEQGGNITVVFPRMGETEKSGTTFAIMLGLE